MKKKKKKSRIDWLNALVEAIIQLIVGIILILIGNKLR